MEAETIPMDGSYEPEGGGGGGLARRLAAGDRDALDTLYRRHADAVYSAVLRIVGPSDAEDLTQEAFLRAFERIDQFGGSGSLGGWVRRIGVNLALTTVRGRKRRRTLLRRRSEERPRMAGPASTSSVDLERAIASLPESQRLVFLLVAVEGRSHREVARELGISEAASRKRYQRARLDLAATLEPEEG